MNFLLKIVEGPNRGAEIALVEGVTVTLGKSDECDIVLADATFGDEPMKLLAAGDGVSADGERLEQFHVVERGSTALAVGPADGAWGELVWPSSEPAKEESDKSEGGETPAPGPAPKEDERPAKPRRSGCLGCFVVLLLVVLLLAGLGWFFRDTLRPHADKARPYAEKALAHASGLWDRAVCRVKGGQQPSQADTPPMTLSSVAARYGLELSEEDGRAKLSGDFNTRAERLSATAEAYSAQPGVDIDFADVESLKSAVTDTFELVGESKLSVAAITSRVAVIVGKAANLRKTLKAIAADVPKIVNVDVSGVSLLHMPAGADGAKHDDAAGAGLPDLAPAAKSSVARRAAHDASLPVCGILTLPYPCLVLRDGRRIMEGAPVGNSIVVKIEADSVTLTNAAGKVVWKP